MNSDLAALDELLFSPLDFKITALRPEAESAEYSAHDFTLDDARDETKQLTVKFRVAKTTPTKTGQFVTLWKRKQRGPIEPFSSSDKVDFFFVATRSGKHFGVFIFPKDALIKHGVLSTAKKEGKRAIRVYPPWDKANSAQATRTQKWQFEFFIDLTVGTTAIATPFLPAARRCEAVFRPTAVNSNSPD